MQRENKRLLENNMRLEQENADLAHELVEWKLVLRSDLDVVSNKCELLEKDLPQSKKTLKETEEEKRRLEVECAQEMCRRELERAEQESSRNSTITADYKQICSQLSERLEAQQKAAREELLRTQVSNKCELLEKDLPQSKKTLKETEEERKRLEVESAQICSQLSERLEAQQTAAREELHRIKFEITNCEGCSKLLGADGKIKLPEAKNNELEENTDAAVLKRQVRELELELAQTKLALVESECKKRDLAHQLNSALTELQSSQNTWFHKTVSSIREVAATKKDPTE